MSWRLSLVALWLAGPSLAGAASPAAAASAAANRVAFEKTVLPFVNKYCLSCHNEEKDRGGVNFQAFGSLDAALKDRKTWDAVVHNLRARTMPPKNKPQPAAAETETVLAAVEAGLTAVDCQANRDPGRPTLRRLNRAEYNNTIRDLCGVEGNFAEAFPSDDVGYGFDNIGDVLSMPPILLEKYLAAAEKITDKMVGLKDPPQPTNMFLANWMFFDGEGTKSRKDGEKTITFHSNGTLVADVNVAFDGGYKYKLKANRTGPAGDPLEVQLTVDGKVVGDFKVDAKTTRLEAKELVRLPKGKHKVGVVLLNHKAGAGGEQTLVIHSGGFEGPLGLGGPSYPPSHHRLLGRFAETPKIPQVEQAAVARSVVAEFARKAYRRPVAPAEVERLVGFYELARRQGDDFEAGVKLMLRAVLVSPNFLFKVEVDPNPADPTPHPVGQFELATRLSYFLWSSMPDDELYQAAAAGKLRDPQVVEAQARRMLKDPKASALTENFAGQWLQLRLLPGFMPDKDQFWKFGPQLKEAMERETQSYFEHVARDDRSVLEFLDSDYSFLNEALAKHYGVPGVKGEEFRKVTFAAELANQRGGVLTHGSVLAITSNPTRTSPVKRGKWILENILGSPPPPAPPDVPELDEGKKAAASGSLRQRMELHRKNPACASCHQRMDPLGFGFENFDAVGTWRDKDGGFKIDPAGELPDGSSFRGPKELRQLLVKQRADEFLHCLSEKMVTYATGRGVEYYDKCVLDDISRAVKADGHKFSRLVVEVVEVRTVPETPWQEGGKMTQPLSRRTLLKGVGAAVALPVLDAMLPALASAAPAATGTRPTRLAWLYVPNGKHMADWTPATEGAGYKTPWIMEPLEAHKGDFSVLTGLTLDKARANGDGGGDHARANAAFLTGRQPRKTYGADLRAGLSIDQFAADRVGRDTKFGSIELGCERGGQAGNCDSGYSCAYSSSISWRGETTPAGKGDRPEGRVRTPVRGRRPEGVGRHPRQARGVQQVDPRLRAGRRQVAAH